MKLHEIIDKFAKIPGLSLKIHRIPDDSLPIYDFAENPDTDILADKNTLYVISDNNRHPFSDSAYFYAATFTEGDILRLEHADALIELEFTCPQQALSETDTTCSHRALSETDTTCSHRALLELSSAFRTLQKLESDMLSMFQALVMNLGIQQLANIATARLKNPLFLLDQTLHLLTKIPRTFPVTNATMQAEISIGHLLPETIEQIQQNKILEAIHHSDCPYTWNIPQGITFAAYPVRHGNIIIAYMMLLQSGPAFTQEDMDFFQSIGKIFSCELMKESNFLQNKGSRYAAIVEDLITGSEYNSNIPGFLSSLGYQLREYCTVFVIPIFSESVTDGHAFLQLGETLKQFLSHGLYLIKEQHLIFLFDSDQELTTFQKEGLEKMLSSNHLTCGISSRKHGLTSVRRQYEEAREALRLGKILTSGTCLCFYTDFQAYHAVSMAKEIINPDTFAGGILSKLMEYDQQNETALLTTLGIYLMHGQNISQTAAALFIHENTLRYRIRKISELTGIDIHQGTTFFEIMLCLYAMRLSEDTAEKVEPIFASDQ
ncbi:MAG: PucR family transcriptional regulator [Brotaphodocola sp.]